MLRKTGHLAMMLKALIAIGSFLERIVVERANDGLCLRNIKNAGLISAKPIDF